MFSISEGAIYGLGNPLIDLIANVDIDFLKKWGFQPNDAILASDRHDGLVDDLTKHYNIKYISGGSVLNSMRIAQWLLHMMPKTCTYVGCIGNDELGNIMKSNGEREGLNCAFEIDENTKTGYCTVLITMEGKNRSLCAYLGASKNLKKDHILKHWNLVEKARILYISGFHIISCFPGMMELAIYSSKCEDKVFCLNLSAVFISQFHSKELLQILPYVDTLFGNEQEIVALAKAKCWNTEDIRQIMKLYLNDVRASKKTTLIIITQGKDPVLVCSSTDNVIKEFPVQEIPSNEIVDTNGAGDAFVGGYLSQMILNEPLEKRIQVAIYAAQQIIKQDGCTIPNLKPSF